MRGEGMDNVIFAGTAHRPARDFAEVMLTAETDTAGPWGGELEVVRRIERGAGSAYRINGKDVRAKDVALVCADAARLNSDGARAALQSAMAAGAALEQALAVGRERLSAHRGEIKSWRGRESEGARARPRGGWPK